MILLTKLKSKGKKLSGFTLIETLMTVFIFSIIMLGTTALLRNIFITSGQQSLALESVDQARLALSAFINEIRNAANGNDGAYPLNKTDNAEIIFFSTYGASSNNVNRIRYYTNSGILYKGTVTPTGSPLTYNLGSEITKPVLKNIATSSTLFSYYDDNYTGTSTPLAQPININQVNFVQIGITLLKKDVRNGTSTATFVVGATMRNLKTNLGN